MDGACTNMTRICFFSPLVRIDEKPADRKYRILQLAYARFCGGHHKRHTTAYTMLQS